MLISVLIPTYNQESYIEQTVQSVLNQSYQHIEILVGDDNSSDNTPSIIKKLQRSAGNITYFRHEPNIGRVKNYNFLLHQAKGEWTINLDGDDYFSDPDFISRCVEEITARNEDTIHLVLAKYQILDQSTLINHPSKFDNSSSEVILLNGKNDFLPSIETIGSGHLTSLYKTDLARKLHFYEVDILTADSESVIRLALQGDILFLNKHVAVWRKSDSNASNHSKIPEFFKSFQRNDLIREACESLKFSPEYYLPFIRSMEISHAQRIFGRIFHEKQYQYAAEFLTICKNRSIPLRAVFAKKHMLFKLIKLTCIRPKTGFRICLSLFTQKV